RDIMEMVAPLGPVYQAGTLSGNPLAMRAGLAALAELESRGFYEELERRTHQLVDGLRIAIRDSGIPAQVNSAGSLLTLFFCAEPVRNYAGAKKSDAKRFARFFQAMLARGLFLPPSQFEAWFISAAHTPGIIVRTIAAASESMREISRT
ncbi:MAG: aminotransferase class III-fold pyridoxal phosphate-dependent enzyme, partial [Steroidobacteraceae bacterium]